MLVQEINEEKILIAIHNTKSVLLELGETNRFIAEPIPNDVYAEIGVSPKWDGEQWVATTESPETEPQPPTEVEKLEAKINAANEYTDFLEEVIVEMAQAVYG